MKEEHPTPLSECSPEELRSRGFRLVRKRAYKNPPLSEQIASAKTVKEVSGILKAAAACPTVSSGTVRKLEKIARTRIAELYRSASQFAGQLMAGTT